jgi:hypothetical protein
LNGNITFEGEYLNGRKIIEKGEILKYKGKWYANFPI